MKAIQFNATIPRYILGRLLGKLAPALLWSGLSCTSYQDLPDPTPPAEGWQIVRTRYGGICGTDLSAIHLHTSPYFSTLASFPYIFGHENTGRAQDGERVVIEPHLWCKPRGFSDLCPACARGETNRCQRATEGQLAPGLLIGATRGTGGSWSPAFSAHESQIYRLPDSISDEEALMVEPFAVGLHAVLNANGASGAIPRDDQSVLIVGAGSIGLCTLAALRAVGSKAAVVSLARHPFQADAARRLGAEHVILSGRGQDAYAAFASLTNARLLKPLIGKRVVLGGADLTFECVGSDSSLDDALRLTRSGGRVILVGVPGIAQGVDWSAIFAQELTVQASNTYNHAELLHGQRAGTFDLAIELTASSAVDLSWMVTHRYPLEQYGQAFKDASRRNQTGLIKAVFDFPK